MSKKDLPEKVSGRKAVKYRGVKCLNCGHPLDLSDVYCSYCGQLNTKKKLALSDFFGEFLSSIVNYDSRLRHTVKDLLFRPGVITRNYVAGQRFRYANPFRFFLSTSIIYFLIQGLVSSVTGDNKFVNWDDPSKQIISEKDSLVNLANTKMPKGEEIHFENNQLIVGKDTVPFKMNAKKDKNEYTYYSEAQLDTLSRGEKLTKRMGLYRDFYNATKIKDPHKALDSLKHENTSWNRWMYSKNGTWDRIKENPSAFFNYLLNKVPFFLFFFAPFFALFFWLIYSKKKYNYMEHLIFIFHIFGFVFLGMLLCFIPDLLLNTEAFTGILFALIGPFYFYKALRNFYQQNRFITILKFIFLNFVFINSALLIAILFFGITAATY